MRGPATLALMSLLLFHGGAQPLSTPTTEKQPGGMGGYSSSYPQSFDCGGNAELTQDDSGTTLACDGNKYPLEPCEDGKNLNLNQMMENGVGKTTVTCDDPSSPPPPPTFCPGFPFCDNQGNGGIETHGSWPGVDTHRMNWPFRPWPLWPGQQGNWLPSYWPFFWRGQQGNLPQQHGSRNWHWK